MAGCEAPVPTPPVSLKDVLDAAWAQHPESRALPGRRDAAQAQQWAAAAWTPISQQWDGQGAFLVHESLCCNPIRSSFHTE